MTKICSFLDISKSWYYEMKASLERQKEYEKAILNAVRQIRAEHPVYGTKKLWKQLERNGVTIGRDRLHRLLTKHGLILPRHYKKVRTSFPGIYDQGFENKLKGLNVTHINQVWCTDITYIHTAEGMLYISAMMDVYSRKIISLNISNNLRTDGSLDCLSKALHHIPTASGIIHHSDHGTQYCSYRYLSLLSSNGMQISFTGKDHCYDNAKIERFFNTLKHEYGLKGVIKSKKLAIEMVKNAIYDYNYKRLHAALGYKIPYEVYDAA
jgi:transposase InsO family protein